MYRQILRKIKRWSGLDKIGPKSYQEINPEDIFLDSQNLPGFLVRGVGGRIEKPVSQTTFLVVKIVLLIVVLALISKLWILGVRDGQTYAQISENNRLEQTLIFANRGIIYDREMRKLATNEIKEEGRDFALRLYPYTNGLSHLIGFISYPSQDKTGVYYETNYFGRDGVESVFDQILNGENGLRLKETNVFGEVISESVVRPPRDGESLVLSVDAELTRVMHQAIAQLTEEKNFVGGAGVVLDVRTGEVLVMTSYPEYNPNILTDGRDRDSINTMLNNSAKPFLNRTIGGLYPPGSTLKPIVALAALNENIISPEEEILSTGSITIPNPYDSSKSSVLRDWKVHGWTDMREALAVSSDTYFYSIGGGYADQKGLGITLLDHYFTLFGIDELSGIELLGEVKGVIPTPEWKKEKFNGDIWRLGDTYITSIGQYGTQVTPLNAARFTAAIANGGKILKTSILLGGYSDPVERVVKSNKDSWQVVREGMREAVTYGTSLGLNVPYIDVAAKTGTAEIGSAKRYVHSWSVGFWPTNIPRYAWAVVMEKGPSSNTLGATSVARTFLDWISLNAPQYF